MSISRLSAKAIVTLASLALGIPGVAQKAVSRKGPVVHHHEAHHQGAHRASSAPLPNDSNQMNANLSKVEGETARLIRPAQRARQNRAATSSKPSKPSTRQDHSTNPPINFTYKAPNTSSSTMRTSRSNPSSGSGIRLK